MSELCASSSANSIKAFGVYFLCLLVRVIQGNQPWRAAENGSTRDSSEAARNGASLSYEVQSHLFVFLEEIHIEIAACFKPVLMGFHRQGANET